MAAKGYDQMTQGVGKRTPQGAVVDVKVYAYPDGHGNLIVDGVNRPVADDIEAIDALVAMWRGLRLTSRHTVPERELAKV